MQPPPTGAQMPQLALQQYSFAPQVRLPHDASGTHTPFSQRVPAAQRTVAQGSRGAHAGAVAAQRPSR
jgi:hypothetical protein